ncbi:MAG: NAD(P)H-hydrate dehydratase, partial [Candidatus Limnocylindria bacterium]
MTGTTSISQRWVASHLPPRPERAHKGDFGRLLVIAGSTEYPGAAMLTALGAMRAGAGSVRVAVAASVAASLAGIVPELTWMVLDEEAPGLIAPSGWRRITTEAARYDAIVVGPGLGRHPATQRRIRNVVVSLRVPSAIDADGLNALAEGGKWWTGLRAPLVLTPHPGEFARLIGEEAAIEDDDTARSTAAHEAATRWGQVVVLKGANTIVAGPGGELLRSDVASPALATAGSGDVLA